MRPASDSAKTGSSRGRCWRAQTRRQAETLDFPEDQPAEGL